MTSNRLRKVLTAFCLVAPIILLEDICNADTYDYNFYISTVMIVGFIISFVLLVRKYRYKKPIVDAVEVISPTVLQYTNSKGENIYISGNNVLLLKLLFESLD